MDNEQIVELYYENFNEETRVIKDQAHMIEYNITMKYINKYLKPDSKIIEVGCGTGVYSLSLADRGLDITAVDISEKNLNLLQQKVTVNSNIHIYKRNAVSLYNIADNTFDICLCLGPLYHLFDKKDINQALSEMKRVTKNNGIIFISYLSQDYIMMREPEKIFNNPSKYLSSNYNFISRIQDVFYYFTIDKFRRLMQEHELFQECLFTMDGITSFIREDVNKLDQEAYSHYMAYSLKNCEREELMGFSPHLCYITYNIK